MNIVIPKPVNEVMNLLYDNNYEGYIIGGAVRNMVMGEKPKNYNISTNASINDIQKIYKSYTTYLSGEKNDVLAIVNSKFPMEITRYRTIENTLEADLASRDFTMNALAYSDEDGLIDYSTGIQDIRNKVIRVNGEDDKIFVEDPLRILRAIRLSAEYGMRIDPDTQEYMFDNRELLKDVAPERIRDELSKLLVTQRCEFYIKKYFDIFLCIIPELALMENFVQNDPHHIYDVLEHTFVALKNVEPRLELRLAMLFHDVAKPFTYIKDQNGIGRFPDHDKKGADMAREILNRLKFNKKTIQKVTKLIEYHSYEIPDKEPRIKQFLTKFGTEDLDDLFKIKRANFYAKSPAYTSEISKIEEDYVRVKAATRKTSFVKKNELKINGRDLLNLGVPQENVGKVLDSIYDMVLSGTLKNKHDRMVEYIINNILPSQYDEELFKKEA